MANKALSDLTDSATLSGNEILEVSRPSTTIKITASTLSALASDNSYNDSANGFVAAGFAVGDRVHVTGFTGDTANNIYVGVVTALTAGKMTIGGTDGDVIVDDAAGESVTIAKWVTRRIAASLLSSTIFSEVRPMGSASSTAQASKGTRITPQVNLSVSKIRIGFNALAGAQYKVSVWTLSGSNLGTLVAQTSTWTEPSTLTGQFRFLDLAFNLTAGTTYFIALSALNQGDTYALPLNSTTSSAYFSNIPATDVDYGRLAKAALAPGDVVSFGSGAYGTDIFARYTS